jgi:2'-5' RNA ligase
MKLKGSVIPAQAVFEYFLIIGLPAEIQNNILELRKQFHLTVNTGYSIKGVPTLAIAHFLQYEIIQQRVINCFKKVASTHPPMEIKLINFGSFPTHSIHVKVDEQSGLHALAKDIRTSCKRVMQINKETKPMIALEPHIGIIRKLNPETYNKSWPLYEHASFNATYHTNSIVLLRRPVGVKRWALVEEFKLENGTSPVTQGSLF